MSKTGTACSCIKKRARAAVLPKQPGKFSLGFTKEENTVYLIASNNVNDNKKLAVAMSQVGFSNEMRMCPGLHSQTSSNL